MKSWLTSHESSLWLYWFNWIFWILSKIPWLEVYRDARSTNAFITSGVRQMELNISSRSNSSICKTLVRRLTSSNMVGESSIDQTFSAVDRPLNPWQVTTSSRGMFGEAAIPRGDLNRIYSEWYNKDRPRLHVDSGFNTLLPRHEMILEPIDQDFSMKLEVHAWPPNMLGLDVTYLVGLYIFLFFFSNALHLFLCDEFLDHNV